MTDERSEHTASTPEDLSSVEIIDDLRAELAANAATIAAQAAEIERLTKELEERDWRIGLTVKPKYRNDPLYYEQGVVTGVFKGGTNGIGGANGVLRIALQSGMTILRDAEDWVTA